MTTIVFTTRSSASLSLFIMLRGRSEHIQFIPPSVYGKVGEATFATCDENVIKALREHPYFNYIFFVKEEIKGSDKPSATAKKSAEDYLQNKDTAIVDSTVTTKKMAAAFIQGQFNEFFSPESTTVEEMKIEAARRWNVLFEKWGE